jgi:hypothetical protein
MRSCGAPRRSVFPEPAFGIVLVAISVMKPVSQGDSFGSKWALCRLLPLGAHGRKRARICPVPRCVGHRLSTHLAQEVHFVWHTRIICPTEPIGESSPCNAHK